MASATRFFYQHTYGYDPQGQRRRARELAHAEAHARRMAWVCTWEEDDMSWDGDGPEPDEVLGCVLRNARGEHLASLWGIGDPSREYRRVVEAELALEAMDEIQRALDEAI